MGHRLLKYSIAGVAGVCAFALAFAPAAPMTARADDAAQSEPVAGPLTDAELEALPIGAEVYLPEAGDEGGNPGAVPPFGNTPLDPVSGEISELPGPDDGAGAGTDLSNDIRPIAPGDIRDPRTGGPMTNAPADAAVVAGGAGYTKISADTAMISPSYLVKLVSGPGIETYRSHVQQTAAKLNSAGLSRIRVASGTYSASADAREDNVIFIRRSPASQVICGVANAVGCGGPSGYWRADGRSTYWNGGHITFNDVIAGYSWSARQEVVDHEIGHVLGLGHYSEDFQGQRQVMHPVVHSSWGYKAGDLNGLRALSRNTSPKGALTAVTSPANGAVSVQGWGYDPDRLASSPVIVTVDGGIEWRGSASNSLPTVAKQQGIALTGLGFSPQMKALPGTRNVCVYVQNFPVASYVKAACRAVSVAGPKATTTRVAGADRYLTASAVSQAAYPAGADTVYLARGDDFPDALSAGPAAAAAQGPLLLTRPDALPPTTLAEVKRLKPKKLVIVGGPGAISDSLATQLRPYAGQVVRDTGGDRYTVSRAVATRAFSSAKTVYIADGRNYPDAIAAGAAAARVGGPVVLVNGGASTADSATIALLKQLGTTEVRVAGGPTVVSDGILNSLRTATGKATRYFGGDRYQTAAALGKSVAGGSANAYLVNGLNFPDGISAVPLAAKSGAPVYLSRVDCVPPSVITELQRLGATKITLVGSSGVLDANVAALKACSA